MEIIIDAKYIKDVLEAVDESKRIDALFMLKKEYNRILTKEITKNKHHDACLDYNVDREVPECICENKK